jgi:hypothetical protein
MKRPTLLAFVMCCSAAWGQTPSPSSFDSKTGDFTDKRGGRYNVKNVVDLSEKGITYQRTAGGLSGTHVIPFALFSQEVESYLRRLHFESKQRAEKRARTEREIRENTKVYWVKLLRFRDGGALASIRSTVEAPSTDSQKRYRPIGAEEAAFISPLSKESFLSGDDVVLMLYPAGVYESGEIRIKQFLIVRE